MKVLLINCGHTGVSGDLLLSGLAEIIGIKKLTHFLQNACNLLGKDRDLRAGFHKKKSHGITGLHFSLVGLAEKDDNHENSQKKRHYPEKNHNPKKDHSHEHHIARTQLNGKNEGNSAHHHSHYSIEHMKRDFSQVCDSQRFSPQARKIVSRIFEAIVEAESKVHSIPLNKVHLHELGSLDTILDVTGVVYALDQLEAFESPKTLEILFSPIAVGGGTVKIAHGHLPVPAPATAEILEKFNVEFMYGPEERELATPTGVAILGVLKDSGFAKQMLPRGAFSIDKKGLGLGTLQLEKRPNMLQVFLGTLGTESKFNKSPQETDILSKEDGSFLGSSFEVYLLKTNVDDVRGELLGNVIDSLMEHGALDVYILSTTTKKNRPGYLISVICNKSKVAELSTLLMRETGTLGVRIQKQRRVCLDREIVEKHVKIKGKKFIVRIKQSRSDKGDIFQQKIEFDDLKRIAIELDLTPREVEISINSKLNSSPWKEEKKI